MRYQLNVAKFFDSDVLDGLLSAGTDELTNRLRELADEELAIEGEMAADEALAEAAINHKALAFPYRERKKGNRLLRGAIAEILAERSRR